MFVLYNKDKSKARTKQYRQSTEREQKKRNPPGAWMFVLCFVNNTQKSKMQDNQDKETRVYRLCCKN
jgi:hypothetical protein